MTRRPDAAMIGKYDGEGRWMCWPALVTLVSAPARIASNPGSRTSRPSSSSVYFRCQKSSRPCTVGTSAKLYSGGGDGIDHSRVLASHGSAEAGALLGVTTSAL